MRSNGRFFHLVLRLGLALAIVVATADPAVSDAATPSRTGLLRELLEERIAANVERLSGLGRQHGTLLQLAALGDGGTPSEDTAIEAIEREVERLVREIDILRAELIALAHPAADLDQPPPLAGTPAEAVQESLVYLGHYDGRIDGRLGRRSEQAIAAYQRSFGHAPTGTLSDQERRALLDEAAIRREAHGMRLAADDQAGYAFLYPGRLLPFERQEGGDYRRFSSPAEKASLQVVSAPVERLETLYATLLARPGFAVAYSRLGDGWFVVAGEVGDMLFYDIARSERRTLIRLRLAYPLADRALWDPMTVILFNSFRVEAPDTQVSLR